MSRKAQTGQQLRRKPQQPRLPGCRVAHADMEPDLDEIEPDGKAEAYRQGYVDGVHAHLRHAARRRAIAMYYRPSQAGSNRKVNRGKT